MLGYEMTMRIFDNIGNPIYEAKFTHTYWGPEYFFMIWRHTHRVEFLKMTFLVPMSLLLGA